MGIVLNNVNRTAFKKNCLLKYITSPFAEPSRCRCWHQNIWQVPMLAALIGEFGYDVDVMNWQDNAPELTNGYELLIDISPHNRHVYQQYLSPACRQILYATGSAPVWQRKQEEARLEALYERRGNRLAPHTQMEYQYPHPNSYDSFFLIGNQHTLQTFGTVESTKVSLIKNNGYIIVPDLDFSLKSPGSFLFFASQPQVLKGLDLLLEVFSKNPAATLYVCSMFQNEPDFCQVYQAELFQCSNIKAIGFIDTAGAVFRELIRRCSYVILPSCSEGICGSVLTAMSSGLIPIVSRECGLNADEAFILEDCDIKYLNDAVADFSGKSQDWVRRQSIQSLEIIKERYSPRNYISSIQTALEKALGFQYGYTATIPDITLERRTCMIANTRLGIPLTGGKYWYGGVTHIEAIVRAVGALPKEERPQLYLVVTDSSSHDYECYQAFSQLFDGIIFVGQNPANFVNQWAVKVIHCKSWEELFSIIDCYFPVNTEVLSTPKAIPWIPDFQHRHLPEFFSKYEYQTRETQFEKIAEQAQCVIVSTQSVAEDFRQFYPESTTRTVVLTPLPYPNEEWYSPNPRLVQEKYCLPERFILCSNQFWLHKNHLTLFRAISLLKQRGQDVQLVCTGPTEDYRSPTYFAEIKGEIDRLGVGDQITILGMIPRQDQIQLLRQCQFVVQPSLFEGLGLIVLECRTLGKPIIVSDIDVHIEHGYGTVFNRHSAEDLAEKIAVLLESCPVGVDEAVEAKARVDAISAVNKLGRSICSFVLYQLSGSNKVVAKSNSPRITIVTSLSRDNIENQQLAIQSWREVGLRVLVINSHEDIMALRPSFPDVEFKTAHRDAKERYGKRYIYLRDLIDCCRQQTTQICGIVKSDVILRGTGLDVFLEKETVGSIIFGTRCDVPAPDAVEGTFRNGGFDYIFLDKRTIPNYPMESFCLGLDWWDYWMILLAIASGVNAKFLQTAIAYHVIHTTQSNLELWNSLGMVVARYAETEYAVTAATMAQYQQLLFHTIKDNSTQLTASLME